MSSFKETSCRLCHKNITEKGFEVIDDVTRDILNILLLKLNFGEESKAILCNLCKRKLNAAVEFKSVCLNTDYRIIPHVDYEKTLPVDMEEVCMKESGSEHLTDTPYNHKICRLCMQLIEGKIRWIGEEELAAIEKLLPEMNIMIIRDPVICKPCFDSVCTHNTFLKDCLEVEQEINNIFETLATESQVNTSPSDLFTKIENLDEKFEISVEEMLMNTECVDIKPEEGEEESDTLLINLNNQTNTEEEVLKHKQIHKNKTIAKCGINPRGEGSSTLHHSASHSVLYKCETCKYVTKEKNLLNRHVLKHKDLLKVKMYKCDKCIYETQYESVLKKHQLSHKHDSEVQMYKCDTCTFKTKHKANLKDHQPLHKKPLDIQMYKCDFCNYEAKHKGRLTNHLLSPF